MTEVRDSEQTFATLPALLRGLGYELDDEASAGRELESYAESYLYHDAYVNLTGWGKHGSDEFVVLDANGVVMWGLQFPVTRQQLSDYLDELDFRVGRMEVIQQLPDPQEDQPEPGVIEAVIGSVFDVDADRVRQDLGTAWQCITSDAIGTSSTPIAYVGYGTRAVIGFDDQYIYQFRVDRAGKVLDADAGGVAWEAEWPKGGDSALYSSFVVGLRELVASGPHPTAPFRGSHAPESYDIPRGACPQCGSENVTHLIIGMPSGPEAGQGDPPWVRWVGCDHPGYNRKCSACELTWQAHPPAAAPPPLRPRRTPIPRKRPSSSDS